MLIYDTEMFDLIRAAGALTHLSLETIHGAMCFMVKLSGMEINSTFLGDEEIVAESHRFTF